MPKFGAHILFAEQAQQLRPDLFGDVHSNALRFGAVGPDVTLFMFDPATSNPDVRKGFRIALDVQLQIQNIRKEINDITEELSKPLDDIKDWLTGGLSKDLGNLVSSGLETLLLATKLGLALGGGGINLNNPLFKFMTDPNLPADFIRDASLRGPSGLTLTFASPV